MKIADLKKKYKNKWILAKVIKETKEHKVLEMNPLVISDKRDDIYKSLAKLKKGAHVATLYTGEIPAKGMSFTFYVSFEI
ncbi:hypothetical protein HY612_01330 [Candidatus Roizmanbacteria bacterium]|nr:hypothetical protein [Candidatus Roizmanbacteria bacterium]